MEIFSRIQKKGKILSVVDSLLGNRKCWVCGSTVSGIYAISVKILFGQRSVDETLFCNFLFAVLLKKLVIPTFDSYILYFRLSSDLKTDS